MKPEQKESERQSMDGEKITFEKTHLKSGSGAGENERQTMDGEKITFEKTHLKSRSEAGVNERQSMVGKITFEKTHLKSGLATVDGWRKLHLRRRI